MKTPPKRTSISADNLRAVQDPPTTIREKSDGAEVVVDPEKLIKAWAASVDVLKEVSRIVEETQVDNLHTRLVSARNRNIIVGAAVVIVVVGLSSMFLLKDFVGQAEKRVIRLLENQIQLVEQFRDQSVSETAEPGSCLRRGNGWSNGARCGGLGGSRAW